MLGHASILQTQRYLNVTDEELRRGFGGELEEPRTTASVGFVRQLMRSRRFARLSRFCSADREKVAPQAGFVHARAERSESRREL
jgi:hypothetical protein